MVREDEAAIITQHYKTFLSYYDDEFAALVPQDESANWTTLTVVQVASEDALGVTVQFTPSSISYINFDSAVRIGANIVTFIPYSNQPQTTTTATAASVSLAAEIVGAAFGNDGTPPSRLSIEIGPQGSSATRSAQCRTECVSSASSDDSSSHRGPQGHARVGLQVQ